MRAASVILAALLMAGCAKPVPYSDSTKATAMVESDDGFGSGVFFRDGRTVLTAAHVIGDSKTGIKISNSFTGRTNLAEVIAINKELDIAVLRILTPQRVPQVVLDPRPAPPGTSIYHIGNFMGPGLPDSLVAGIVSRIGRFPTSGELAVPWTGELGQADIYVLPGGSGGGVFDNTGHLRGIVVGKMGSGNVVVFVTSKQIAEWVRKEHLEKYVEILL